MGMPQARETPFLSKANQKRSQALRGLQVVFWNSKKEAGAPSGCLNPEGLSKKNRPRRQEKIIRRGLQRVDVPRAGAALRPGHRRELLVLRLRGGGEDLPSHGLKGERTDPPN